MEPSERTKKVASIIKSRQLRSDSIINEAPQINIISSHIYKYIKPFDPRLDLWTKENWILAAYVLTLVGATSLERVSFKMAVDDMTPFRYVLLLFMLILSILIYSMILLFKRFYLVIILLI